MNEKAFSFIHLRIHQLTKRRQWLNQTVAGTRPTGQTIGKLGEALERRGVG